MSARGGEWVGRFTTQVLQYMVNPYEAVMNDFVKYKWHGYRIQKDPHDGDTLQVINPKTGKTICEGSAITFGVFYLENPVLPGNTSYHISEQSEMVRLLVDCKCMNVSER